jgi:integrase
MGELRKVEGRAWKRYLGRGDMTSPRPDHASVLLSKRVSPALVAERLGHDLKTLLRTYAHVIRQDEDRVRAIVDVTLGGDAEDWLRTEVV